MRHPVTLPAVVLVGLMSAMAAQAQWKWRDADGSVNYSDRPPPASVPASQVTRLERSGVARPAPTDPAPAAAGAAHTGEASATSPPAGDVAAGGDGAAPAPSWADREAEFRRRHEDRKAAKRKAQEQAQAAANLARLCESARGQLRTLESGMRVGQVNADGEREVLGDEERAARAEQLRREVRVQCRSS